MNIRPLHNQVAVQYAPTETGKIILTGKSASSPVVAIVKAVGRKVESVKPGNKVMIEKFINPQSADKFVLINESDIWAVL